MFSEFFTHELTYRFKRTSTWVYFSLILFTSFLGILSAGGVFTGVDVNAGDSTGKVHLNSPYIIFNISALWSYLGLLIVTAIMMNVTLRDFQSGAFPLFFTKPIHKVAYLTGRFAGGFVTILFIFSGVGLGIFLATIMPILDPELIGPFRLSYFLNPYLVMIIPNLFILSAIFFCISILTRKAMPVYSAAVVLLIGYLLAMGMMASLDNRQLASLLEPLGFTASMIASIDYWTIVQKNTRIIPLEGAFLWNRILWIGIAALLALWTVWRFRFAQFVGDRPGKRLENNENKEDTAYTPSHVTIAPAAPIETTQPRFNIASHWIMLWRSICYETAAIVKSVPFLVIILSSILFLAVNTRYIGYIFGTPGYPVTYKILENLAGQFILFILIIVTFYAGEVVWRSRDLKTSQILDAAPIPGWAAYLSRVGALCLVLALMLPVVFLTGIAIQTFRGYYNYEIPLYIVDLLVFNYPTYVLLAALAVAVQSVVSSKYMGHLIMILYYMSTDFMEEFGFQHILYAYSRDLGTTYSDMNGYGHLIWPYMVTKTYWFAIAALLLIIGYIFWPRGTELNIRARFRTARRRMTPALWIGTAAVTGIAAGLGGFIYYNTNVLNTYYTSWDVETLQEEYERWYKSVENEPQPRITDVSVRVELYPDQRAMEANGRYTLKNTTNRPVNAVYVTIPEQDIRLETLNLERAFRRDINDPEHGFYSLIPDSPIQPGDTETLTFAVAYRPRGFPNARINNDFAANGTFFNNKRYFPSIGYMQDMELTSDVTRKKHDLPPKPRMASMDDALQLSNNYVSADADWIQFDAVIGTAADQTAVTCGHRIREWTENGRRYFQYKMDRPMIHFYPVLSARYAVMKDTWNGVDLAIYYHPAHRWNLDRFMNSMKRSLEYYSEEFSPFQFDQLRIIEFPRYNSFAQSFANTIPYSESAGFVAQITGDDVDYPFGITAHETAHQWWAHQVIGANVQGTTMLSEMLAQYGELMMACQEYPEAVTRQYLRYELDHYLRGRSFEANGELPMILNENQGYIHYYKASMIMNLLQDVLGAETVNLALSDFLSDYAYSGPPYPRSVDLIPYFRRVCPERYQYLITDLFERIVLYDNKATEANAVQLPDGRYEVTVAAEIHKLRVEGLGEEIEEPLNDWVEIGVLGEDDSVLFLERRFVDRNQVEMTVRVNDRPVEAGIDPLNKLIDKRPGDNRIKVR